MKGLNILLVFVFGVLLVGVVSGAEGDYIDSWDTAATGNDNVRGITTYGNFIWIVNGLGPEVYKYDINGVFIDSWDRYPPFVPPTPGWAIARGITTDGINIWVVSQQDDRVYKFDMNGADLGSWLPVTPGTSSPYGITTYGTNIWMTSGSTVYRYDMNFFLLDSWSTAESGNGDPFGITTNGVNIWTIDATDDEVYKFDMDGNYIGSWDTGASGNGWPLGITTNGKFIWVSDVQDDEVYRYEGPCECLTGETSCSGLNYLTCNDGCSWTNNGQVIGLCGVPGGTCSDGVLNQDEIGIDCGGVCPACVSCSDSDRIMKLSSLSNAHGALWNDSDYVYDICYSDFFGNYTGELATVHNCVGAGLIPDNKIVGLSDISNAHAEAPNLDGYGVDVCYGDLSCVVRSIICEADEEVVLSLESYSNSHLAEGDFLAYPRKICCGGGGGSSVLRWEDTSGNEIGGTTGIGADVGDTVRMVKTRSLSGTFEIFDDDMAFDNDVRTVGLENEIVGVGVGVDVVGEWTITEEDLARAYDLFGEDYDGFYFVVDDDGIESAYLTVNEDESDDEMDVSITAPNCGDAFDEGNAVTINVTANDTDDGIDGKVNVDGLVFPFGNGGTKFSHTFSSFGNHQVVVSAVNSRGKRSRSIASVMILDKEGVNYVDGNYVAACITKPEDFSDIPGSYVDFIANETKAIKVVGGVRNYISPGSSDLDFYWTFFPEVRTYGWQYNGTGNSLAYDFGTVFADAGDNSAMLRVEIN